LPGALRQDRLTTTLLQVNAALRRAQPGSDAATILQARRSLLLASIRSLVDIQRELLAGRLPPSGAGERYSVFLDNQRTALVELRTFITAVVQGTNSSSVFRFDANF
jgi:hypothetical protein